MTLRRNILASWFSHGVTLAIGLFLMPFVLHTMGDEGYGVWVLINSVAGYAGLLYFGFGATICKYVSQQAARDEWPELSHVVSTIFCFYLGMAGLIVLSSLLFALAAPWLDAWFDLWGGTSNPQVQVTILLLGCSSALGMAGSVYGGILIGMQRFDLKRAIEVTMGVVRLCLVVLFLNQKQGLMILAGIFLAVTLLEQLLYIAAAWRIAPKVQVRVSLFSWSKLRETASFSSYAALGLFSEYLIYLTDTLVIGMILGAKAVVPYYIGLRLCQMIRVPIEQIAEVMLPRAGHLHSRGDTSQLHRLVTLGMGLNFLLAGGFFLGTICFGDLLITAWVGPEYDLSYLVLVILMSAQLAALPMNVVRKALLGTGSVRLASLIDLSEAILNLVLSLVLIHQFGIIGVAYGTLIPLVLVELGVLLPCASKQLGLPVSKMLRACVIDQSLPLLGLTAYSLAVRHVCPLEPEWWQLLTVAAGGGAVLAVVWWGQYRVRALSRERSQMADAVRHPSHDAIQPACQETAPIVPAELSLR